MKHLRFTYWKDGEYYIGFLNDFPDYESQGKTLEELKGNLKSLYEDIENIDIPYIRHVDELVIK
jgi:predicted RNase H-like HicB family nuclease